MTAVRPTIYYRIIYVYPNFYCYHLGPALFLSPLLRAGKIDEARKLAAVGLGGIESYSGYFSVNKDSCNSSLFFWFFPSAVVLRGFRIKLYLMLGEDAAYRGCFPRTCTAHAGILLGSRQIFALEDCTEVQSRLLHVCITVFNSSRTLTTSS